MAMGHEWRECRIEYDMRWRRCNRAWKKPPCHPLDCQVIEVSVKSLATARSPYPAILFKIKIFVLPHTRDLVCRWHEDFWSKMRAQERVGIQIYDGACRLKQCGWKLPAAYCQDAEVSIEIAC